MRIGSEIKTRQASRLICQLHQRNMKKKNRIAATAAINHTEISYIFLSSNFFFAINLYEKSIMKLI